MQEVNKDKFKFSRNLQDKSTKMKSYVNITQLEIISESEENYEVSSILDRAKKFSEVKNRNRK